jgi:hypothetical protein
MMTRRNPKHNAAHITNALRAVTGVIISSNTVNEDTILIDEI